MLSPQQYAQNFAPHPTPVLLAQLYEFQRPLDVFFSSGFELRAESDKGAFESWSKEAAFLRALFPIAQANGSGSTYALWLPQAGNLEDAPVLIFGDEGGVHVVAESLAALLRLLSHDTEPMVDTDKVYYYKLEDADVSHEAASYADWLQKTLQLEPVRTSEEADALVAAAQATHGKAFSAWFERFYAG